MKNIGILSLLLLAACSTQPAASDVTLRLICSSALAKPITYSASDTSETITQINEHNGAFACTCAKDCPP